MYVARLAPFKRHELAGSLESVALVYGSRGDEPRRCSHLRIEKPHWRFINHEMGSGEYHRLSREEVAGVLNRCQVGLCLSKEEGAMRASMEYLLCGLPVVSTKSIGGRDRYFDSENCQYAEDTPESVARAVQEVLRKKTNRQELRRSTMQKVRFDRQDFVSTLNEIVAASWGMRNLFGSYSPFVGYMKYRPVSEVLMDLRVH